MNQNKIVKNLGLQFFAKTYYKYTVENIDNVNKTVFIHIPKNAGTSISSALGIKKSDHYFASDYLHIIGSQYHSYFSFCFVRNPWSRFLSLYNYAKMDENLYHSVLNPSKARYGVHPDYIKLKNASIKDCANMLMEGKLWNSNHYNHWLPQSNWILDGNGVSLIKFIGKVENMKNDFPTIANQIKIREKLPTLNKSSDQTINYKDFIDGETKKIIADYYAKDIELFGYSF